MLTIVFMYFRPSFTYALENSSNGKISQKVLEVNSEAHQIKKLYDSGNLVGVIPDEKKIDKLLDDVYKERYEDTFPNAELDIGKDMYITEELSYVVYEDVDDQLVTYINEKNVFTIATTAVEFSNENGIYEVIYVQDTEMFQEALREYLSLFVEEGQLQTLLNNQKTPSLTTYGSRDIQLQVLQNISLSSSYAQPEEVFITKDAILNFLEYGRNEEREYYTVKEYDTVKGVGTRNYGLSGEQVVNINRDVLHSVDQVLEPGMQLCVTYFTSPIDVRVIKETMRKEPIYSTEVTYIEDPDLKEGTTYVKEKGKDGSKNTLYEETWINGDLKSGNLIASNDVSQPTATVMVKGTMVVPGFGTGVWRFPADNAFISNGWLGYINHRAIDVQNRYEKWGDVLGADTGAVVQVSFDWIGGNWIIINHNNGYRSYYGHLAVPSTLEVGTVVEKGDVIGKIGMTGVASGPHIHFFIMDEASNRFNPCDGFLGC